MWLQRVGLVFEILNLVMVEHYIVNNGDQIFSMRTENLLI